MNILIAIFSHVIYTSLTTSILIILYLLIKKLFLQNTGGRYHHIIWMILIIRLLIPVIIESPLSIYNFIPDKALFTSESYIGKDTFTTFLKDKEYTFKRNKKYLDNIEYDGEQNEDYTEDSYSIDKEVPEEVKGIKSKKIYETNMIRFSLIWLLGLFLICSYNCVVIIRFKGKVKKLKKTSTCEMKIIAEKCRKEMNIRKSIPVYLDDYFKSPCILGALSPCIFLPESIYKELNYSELRYILLHEMAHYKRKDLFFNLITTLAVIIHWFNPLLWTVLKNIRNDREIACDTYVLEIIREDEVIPYGMTIINTAKLFVNKYRKMYLVSFFEMNSLLERRIQMIEAFKKGTARTTIMSILLCVIIGGVTLTNAVESKKISDGDELKAAEIINIEEQETSDDIKNDEEFNSYQELLKDKIIVIDPGHGGNDTGAIYAKNNEPPIKEKELNLIIALLLKDMLEESGINVRLTRNEDVEMSLKDRMELAEDLNASLFVSIHFEGNPNPAAKGTFTRYNSSKDHTVYGVTGKKAAKLLHNEVIKELDMEDAGMSTMYKLKYNNLKMPAVSIASAFLTNESDREKLMSEGFELEVAKALHNGIINVINEMIKVEALKKNEYIVKEMKKAFEWPVPENYHIVSPFGERIHPILNKNIVHTGIDIMAPEGEDIIASEEGKIVFANELGGYGKTIIIDHGKGLMTMYGEASELIVSVGDKVNRGQKIAEVGSTGDVEGSHLHFEVRVYGESVDPMDYIKILKNIQSRDGVVNEIQKLESVEEIKI